MAMQSGLLDQFGQPYSSTRYPDRQFADMARKLQVAKREAVRAKYDAAQTSTGNENHWANADTLDPHSAASAETHDMFCNHVCSSEYPEPVTARGRTKNQWKEREGRPDNDWLDCCVGVMALLSWLGASLKTTGEAEVMPRARRRLSDRWRSKRDA